MLLLILFVLFYIVIDNRNAKVTVEELVNNYSIDRQSADKNYLNTDIELTGKFKSFLQSANGENYVQLESSNNLMNVYCIIEASILLERTSVITSGTQIVIFGKCLGLKEDTFDSSLTSIYIETKNIK